MSGVQVCELQQTGGFRQFETVRTGRLHQSMAQIKFPFKPTFSGHETFVLRQLWLRKAFAEVAKHGALAPKSVFSDESAIERFGVGKNMVASIRHWALACDVIRDSEDGESLVAGEIGDFLFGNRGHDPFLERDATVWLVHWLLAGRAKRSATWYVVFNYVDTQSFDSKHVVKLIADYATENKAVRSKTTLVRDVEVCLRGYATVGLRDATEDTAEPLLADLGLLSAASGGIYHFNRGSHYSLPDGVFAYALLEFWERWGRESEASQSTLSFNAIAHDYGSPGRVFKLSEDAVGERLSMISEITNGYLQWTDSSGLRQVSRVGSEPISRIKTKMLRSAYGR